jgi:hypothetical protein
MVGLSMLAAMTVLLGALVVIFTVLEPLVADFVGDSGVSSRAARYRAPTPHATTQVASAPTAPAEVPMTTAAATELPATAPSTFTPDYRVVQRINLRSGPGTSHGVVVVLPTGTGLQSIGEDEATASQRPDQRWLHFRTEAGEEGWIREIDVEPMAL